MKERERERERERETKGDMWHGAREKGKKLLGLKVKSISLSKLSGSHVFFCATY